MNRKKLFTAAKILLSSAAILFLGFALYAAVDSLVSRQVEIRFGYLAAALAVCLIFFVLQAIGWRWCLDKVGHRIPLVPSLAIWFNSQVVKYVPGKVMLPLYRILYCSRVGVSKTRTFVSMVADQVLMTVSSLLIFFAMLPFLSQELDDAVALPMLVLCCVGGLIIIHPRIMNFGVNLALRIARRDPIRIEFSYGALLWLLGFYSLTWLVYGVSAVLTVLAVAQPWAVGMELYFAVSAAFLISWTLGYLGFLTPGGIGVREAVMTAVLAPFLETSVALTVAVLARLIWMLGEVIGAGLTFYWRPKPVPEP